MVKLHDHLESLQHPLIVYPSHSPYDCTNHWKDLEEKSLLLGLPAVIVLTSCFLKWNLSWLKPLGDRHWIWVRFCISSSRGWSLWGLKALIRASLLSLSSSNFSKEWLSPSISSSESSTTYYSIVGTLFSLHVCCLSSGGSDGGGVLFLSLRGRISNPWSLSTIVHLLYDSSLFSCPCSL